MAKDPFQHLNQQQRSMALALWKARQLGGKVAMAEEFRKHFPAQFDFDAHNQEVLARRAAKAKAQS